MREKTQHEWTLLLAGSDVCFAPVLDLAAAPQHPQNRAREAFVDVGGVLQPAPAPRFSRTPGSVSRPFAKPGEHGAEVLAEAGFSPAEIAALRAQGALLEA